MSITLTQKKYACDKLWEAYGEGVEALRRRYSDSLSDFAVRMSRFFCEEVRKRSTSVGMLQRVFALEEENASKGAKILPRIGNKGGEFVPPLLPVSTCRMTLTDLIPGFRNAEARYQELVSVEAEKTTEAFKAASSRLLEECKGIEMKIMLGEDAESTRLVIVGLKEIIQRLVKGEEDEPAGTEILREKN